MKYVFDWQALGGCLGTLIVLALISVGCFVVYFLFNAILFILPAILAYIKNQPIQVRIISHNIHSLLQFRNIIDVHTHIFDQRHQVSGRDKLRQIKIHLISGTQRSHIRIVKHSH